MYTLLWMDASYLNKRLHNDVLGNNKKGKDSKRKENNVLKKGVTLVQDSFVTQKYKGQDFRKTKKRNKVVLTLWMSFGEAFTGNTNGEGMNLIWQRIGLAHR